MDINKVNTSMQELSNIFTPIISPIDTEPSDENLKSQSEIISKVYPNDVCAHMLAEELRIFYKVCKETKIIADD